MNASIKSLILFLLIFIGKPVYSQTTTTDTISNNIEGTWMGSYSLIRKDANDKASRPIYWRIHRVNNLKKEIEITEIGQAFDNGMEINDPKKLVYKGTYIDSTLVVYYNREVANVKYTFVFKRIKMDDLNGLQAEVNEDFDRSKFVKRFSLWKIRDDKSIYDKKAIRKVEVSIAPPPPIKQER